ncbi:OB-fold domain-containing protein [Spirillospora sp. NBC_00431]
MAGILTFGAYLPARRIRRSAIAAGLGTGPSGGARDDGSGGARTVAAYDEDTTTMGAEAARIALASAPAGARPAGGLYFATADPAYLDKTNAATVHAVLGLDPGVPAVDICGAVRSGVGALRAGLLASAPVLVVTSDIRTGLPGGPDERDGGDGAAALLVTGGADEVVAERVGEAARTEELLDRWRLPGERSSRIWDRRFVEEVLAPVGRQALGDALKSAGLTPGDVDHLIVTGAGRRVARAVTSASGVARAAVADDLWTAAGDTGTAHPALLLADVLDRAGPDEVIALLTLSDGADALVFRTTGLLPSRRSPRPVAGQLAAAPDDLSYATFLSWRGFLPREPLRRPLPPQTVAPAAHRAGPWKLGFAGSRCRVCDARHLPPQRVCRECRTADQMAPDPAADLPGVVAIATVDRLAWSPSPPLVYGTVDFEGGGRIQCEITDVDPDEVRAGLRVRTTIRRTHTRDGVHNYFWKVRPDRAAPDQQKPDQQKPDQQKPDQQKPDQQKPDQRKPGREERN